MNNTSGMDFADRAPALDAHPDMVVSNPQKPNLQRNKTERRRLQGLMRTDSNASGPKSGPMDAATMGWADRYNAWMVNEGGRRIFFGLWIFVHALAFALAFVNFQLKDNLTTARATFGITFCFARSAALVLHLDAALILLPICRNFISLLRRTPLNEVIPFDKNLTFHKACAWSMVFFTAVHIIAHMVNFTLFGLSITKSIGPLLVIFLSANFATGPGATGWVMTAALGIMVYYAMDKRKRQPNGGFEKFWYTHHLFLVYFIGWQLHGMWCMIKPDRPPFCSFNNIGVFWRWWLVGGLIFVAERILREVRSRHRTWISKVIQHPSDVIEIQIKKEGWKMRAGQYIFLSCPEVSYWQWHPFTLTSAPEEDYLSVHIRMVGDFTKALGKALGAEVRERGARGGGGGEKKDGGKDDKSKVVVTRGNGPLNAVLPRVMVDGPFGSASEDFANFETVLLVGGGIGVTPFASILKTIWYRMNNFNQSKPTRLSKVYFVWVIRDLGMAEWFHSLLHAIEEQDTQNRIEISIYLTAKLKEDEMNNIYVQDVGAERDAITSLRAPTHFGRPNWDRIFPTIADKHPDTDVGVFFCGPGPLASTLHQMSNKYTNPKGTRFFFGKENF
jgi:NADPH oxidase